MDAWATFKVILGVVASISSASVVIWFFVRLAAKTLADNYKKRIEHNFEKKLEKYKSEIEILRSAVLRYNDKQFELYLDLWKNLQELKFACIDLWNTANKENLKKFNSALNKTYRQVETTSILIEEDHYKELTDVIKNFQEYNNGKRKLVAQWNTAQDYEIEQMIDHNRQQKDKCLEIIAKMKTDIQARIKGK